MDAEILFAAIGEIRDDLILDAEIVSFRPKRRLLRSLTAACLVVLLLTIPVSAELTTGYISNLLAPLYGNAQTELVDSVGVPIGAETTVAGYTLSADAVIGDRYNIAIVYTLRREDGGELPEGLRFRNPGGTFLSPVNLFGGGSGSGSVGQTMSADRKSLKIVEQCSYSGRILLFQRKVTAVFSDLVIWDKEAGTQTMWQEGFWNLSFTVRYRDTTRKLTVDDLEVVNSQGDHFTVHKVEISPFGVHLKLTVPNPNYGKELLKEGASEEEIISRGPKQFEFALRQKDGTIVEAEGGNGGSGKTSQPTFKGHFRAMWDTPIPLEDISALIFCGTEYPVDFR